MSKLNQVIAIEKTVKNRVIADVDAVDKAFQKPALFEGFVKTYKKKKEDEEDVPGQKAVVQWKAGDALKAVQERLTILFDVTAQKDFANCTAKADVVVDGKVVLEKVPATYLLFVEKQLTDLHTLIARIPVLDSAENWTLDTAAGFFKTEASQTSRTKKVQKALVMYPATDKHPAQTQLITEDETVGTWELTKHSGAVPADSRQTLLFRIEKLQAAVKYARENANMTEAPEVEVGKKLFDWIFA